MIPRRSVSVVGALDTIAPMLRHLADSLESEEITALGLNVERRTEDVPEPEPGDKLVPWLRVTPTDEMVVNFKYKINA